jgi:hypothetical protein
MLGFPMICFWLSLIGRGIAVTAAVILYDNLEKQWRNLLVDKECKVASIGHKHKHTKV